VEYKRNISDLPEENCLSTINNKPLTLQLGFILLGLIIIIFLRSFWYFGVMFIVVSILSILVTKDYLACLVYQDKLAVFNPKKQDEFEFVDFDDIISYRVDSKAMSFVLLELKGKEEGINEQLVIATFQAGKLKKKLSKLLPDKDAEQIKMRNFKQSLQSKKRKKVK